MPTPSADSPAHVRAARGDDVAAIGAVQVRAWSAAYRDLLPALAHLDPRALADTWRPAVTDPPSPAHAVVVAVAGGVVVGFAAIDDTGEVVALSVDPLSQRHGHGSRLLAALADHAGEHGIARLGAWVPLADEPRRDFLSSAGFAPDGGLRLLAGGAGDEPDGSEVQEAHLVSALETAG